MTKCKPITSCSACNEKCPSTNCSERKAPQPVSLFFVLRFKQKSLATHPTRNPNDLTVNTVKFRNICEAFDVLSHGN